MEERKLMMRQLAEQQKHAMEQQEEARLGREEAARRRAANPAQRTNSNADNSDQPNSSAMELVERAYRASKNNDTPDAAIDLATRAIKEDPGLMAAFMVRARIYIRESRYQEALADLAKAETLGGSTESLVFAHRGRALFCLGKYAESADAFRKAGDFSGRSRDIDTRGRLLTYRVLTWCALARAGRKADADNELVPLIDKWNLPEDQASQDLYIAATFYVTGRHTLQKFRSNLEIMEVSHHVNTYAAYFYIGEKHLSDGDKKTALESLQTYVKSNKFMESEFQLARAEEKALSAEKPVDSPTPGPTPASPATNAPATPPPPGAIES